ncbi:MAG: carboxynorspermidine decarboxylase [Oscillospiraceae bacterium]|nr:carboxynorspermidine decarboxylase [Oscillospiraceae bacterium]
MRRADLPTPCYIIDEAKLRSNLELLHHVEQESGAHILLAQKAFSCFAVYPLIAEYISGTTASGLYEARLGADEFRKENHVFSPAYDPAEFAELCRICDHISFNSFSQLEKYRPVWEQHSVSVGIRVNPECSTQGDHAIYDPCAPGSRLGVTKANFRPELLRGVEGLHFHTLCEQNANDLITTFAAFEEKFGTYLPHMKWLNLGGGHHITRTDYDVPALIALIRRIREQYGVTVYLEPGEAIALNAGWLDTEIMDIVENGIRILILDASAACHMPDVLEMPYRPPLVNAGEWGEKPYEYRLSSRTCLAGDIIGDYSFDHALQIGERLTFSDMAIYSMVKNNTFNGMPLPTIAVQHENGDCRIIRSFGYTDFKGRLS